MGTRIVFHILMRLIQISYRVTTLKRVIIGYENTQKYLGRPWNETKGSIVLTKYMKNCF